MRIPRRNVPIQPLTYMWERHKEIARLVVAGVRPIDISEKLQMTPCRLSIIMNSPVFKEYLEELSATRNENAMDIKAELLRLTEKGLGAIENALGDAEVSPMSKVKIAQDLLDRTDYGKTSTVNTNNRTTVVTASYLDELKERRKALLGGMKVLEVENG
jgi:hypothetical protein